MFCPVCKCEFRSGFARCESCNADLVEDLAAVEEASSEAEESRPAAVIPMADYCGFLDLNEARQARETLRRERIASDILIRESPESAEAGAVVEEYWLRVDAARFRMVAPILGFDQADQADEPETSACAECGDRIAAEETFCAGCGARVEPS